ncbi:aminotransferase class V-fold PLP-dependent enzyme [Halobaculum rubrum]|uniref:aminotransferase class V-fold PLP-dependent enzyme n=1 Tax=Halobaculum rubrum TaxID=2872158 RepID=UPI001CA41D73|nr:cysteine desulfurase [Halobaculum rubrum]QZY00795.1 cysteine desulfurase [Halobaculum rubrum]
MEAPEQEPYPLDIEAVRADFPILQRKVGGDVTVPGEDEGDTKPLVYLDNAATSHTPDPVVDAIADYYRSYNSNVHRGIHHLSQEASVAYENAHDRVAEFIGAEGREEVVFTKNTTEAENLVAYAWGLNELGPEDNVVLTEMEHHASLVTWQQIGKRTGADVRFIRVDEDGRLDMDHARELVDDDTAMANVVHVSNTLGTVNPVAELADLVHDHDGLIFVDGAQSVPHMPVDVDAIDADFFAFSGHKMCGPTGIGVLYGKEHLLEEMEPYLYGGEMIRKVTFEDSEWEDLPWKFEAGTPVIAQGIALHAAIDYLEDIGMENVHAHEQLLAEYAYDRLTEQDDVDIYGPPGDDRAGLVAFNLDGVHAHDLSSILNDHAVAVRAGDHCTQPLHDKLGVAASARASFYIYNTREEIDKLVEAVDDARQLFA